MTRRKFSREFKLEAVKLVTERGATEARAGRDLELAESVLRRWMREATVAPTTAFPRGDVPMNVEIGSGQRCRGHG